MHGAATALLPWIGTRRLCLVGVPIFRLCVRVVFYYMDHVFAGIHLRRRI